VPSSESVDKAIGKTLTLLKSALFAEQLLSTIAVTKDPTSCSGEPTIFEELTIHKFCYDGDIYADLVPLPRLVVLHHFKVPVPH